MTLADEVEALQDLRHDDIATPQDCCVLCDKIKHLARRVREMEKKVVFYEQQATTMNNQGSRRD